jgi:hypothetical protein
MTMKGCVPFSGAKVFAIMNMPVRETCKRRLTARTG